MSYQGNVARSPELYESFSRQSLEEKIKKLIEAVRFQAEIIELQNKRIINLEKSVFPKLIKSDNYIEKRLENI